MDDDFPMDGLKAYPPGRPLPPDLPEPIRMMLQKMQDEGRTVHIKTVHGDNDVTTGEIHVEGDTSHGDECECVWCGSNRMLAKICESELTLEEKYEAAFKFLFSRAGKLRDEGDRETAFSLQAQALDIQARGRNCMWIIQQCEERIKEQLTLACAKVGADTPKDVKQALGALREHMQGSNDVGQLTELMEYALIVKNLITAQKILRSKPTFEVEPVTDPSALAKLI